MCFENLKKGSIKDRTILFDSKAYSQFTMAQLLEAPSSLAASLKFISLNGSCIALLVSRENIAGRIPRKFIVSYRLEAFW